MPLLELETEGALRVKREVPGAVTIFISARVDELERRLRERATESTGEIGERIELARKQLEQAGEFDHVIENDDLERAVGELTTLVRGLVGAGSYHAAAMIEPRVDDLLENVDSRYALVIVAAKRARQINNYHHQLGEGTFGDNLPPLVESRSKNYLTMAFEEISEGMLKYDYVGPAKARHHAGMARVLLGVTGGIAAYKACELCRLLVKDGPRRRAARHARRRALRHRRDVPRARAASAGDDVYLHLTRADLLVVAPCTANTLAKLAHGLADNVLTEAALAHRGPVLVAPAMNPRMWSHPATRANAETLRARGVVLVGPDEGETAEGELGVGRMAEPEEILRAARTRCSSRQQSAARKAQCSSRRAARASRSTRSASSATARRDGWASRSRPRRAGAAPT